MMLLRPLLALLLLVHLLPSRVLSNPNPNPSPVVSFTPSYFTRVSTTPPTSSFTPRTNAFVFEWAGLMWVVGGVGSTGAALANDVWKSGDLGRTWLQVTATGFTSGGCSTGTSSADVNGGRVTLICAGYDEFGYVHSNAANPVPYQQLAYYSTDAALSQWTAVTSAGGPNNLLAFTVNRMAVPFDGVGSLVSLGGGTPVSSSAVYVSSDSDISWTTQTAAPWPARYGHSTTTDYLQLTLIMTGGVTPAGGTSTLHNDVWQLTWSTAGAQPTQLWYQLQATANFPALKFAALSHVHDWLFLYGGSADSAGGTDNAPLDDVRASVDYGTTWSQMHQRYRTATSRSGAAGHQPPTVHRGRQRRLVLIKRSSFHGCVGGLLVGAAGLEIMTREGMSRER